MNYPNTEVDRLYLPRAQGGLIQFEIAYKTHHNWTNNIYLDTSNNWMLNLFERPNRHKKLNNLLLREKPLDGKYVALSKQAELGQKHISVATEVRVKGRA